MAAVIFLLNADAGISIAGLESRWDSALPIATGTVSGAAVASGGGRSAKKA
jgi:hypothetical protein